MAGLATIPHPSGSQALLYYNTQESTLAMAIRDAVPIGGDDEEVSDRVAASYENTDANAQGVVNNPTSLVAMYLDASDTSLVGIYGVIKEVTSRKCNCQESCLGQLDTTADYGRLCILSPAFKPLGDDTQKVEATYGRLTGIQVPGTKNAGWLYYRSTEDSSFIYKINIDNPKEITKLKEAGNPGTSTFLASHYDATNSVPYVIYQKAGDDEEKKIYEFKDTKKSSVVDIGISNAHFPCGMAAVRVESQKQSYLYYAAKKGSSYHLWRVVKDGDSWGLPSKIDTDGDLSETTQITATALTAKSKNYVVFTTDEGTVETVQDDWETSKS
ncbi:hypothetical protein GGS20DRAFT_582687 [Poronia punctata]|nr:hypothetical protein GGS20DRAFT_582687 [Poronia punctata]